MSAQHAKYEAYCICCALYGVRAISYCAWENLQPLGSY